MIRDSAVNFLRNHSAKPPVALGFGGNFSGLSCQKFPLAVLLLPYHQNYEVDFAWDLVVIGVAGQAMPNDCHVIDNSYCLI